MATNGRGAKENVVFIFKWAFTAQATHRASGVVAVGNFSSRRDPVDMLDEGHTVVGEGYCGEGFFKGMPVNRCNGCI